MPNQPEEKSVSSVTPPKESKKKSRGAKKSQLQETVQNLEQDLARAKADMFNYRQQVSREKQSLQKQATINVLSELLPTLHNVQLAMGSVPEELQENSWAKGVVGVKRILDKAIQDLGVEEVGKVGEEFDPEIHEAISSDGEEATTVSEVVRPGFKFEDRVLQPAMVKVK